MPPLLMDDFLLASTTEMAAFFCGTFFCMAAFSWASLLVVNRVRPACMQ